MRNNEKKHVQYNKKYAYNEKQQIHCSVSKA